jgi:hypothetical protein
VARSLLDRVHAGELGTPPAGEMPGGGPALVRSGWL